MNSHATSTGPKLTVPLPVEAIPMLDQLAAKGVYGETPADVAAGFVLRRLQELLELGVIDAVEIVEDL